jgi:ParB family chromosome partitioning protein
MTTVKRPALGRGLTSLMSQMTPEDAPTRELPVGSLVPNRQQPRTHFDEASMNDLAASLRQHGIVQPIVVRRVGDRFEIIAGERRWRAAKLAGLAMVPVVVKEIPDDRLLELALVENIQRQELNPIEEAKAYWRLGEHLRLTQEQVADRVGKSRPQVANTLRLLRLPGPLQEQIATRKKHPHAVFIKAAAEELTTAWSTKVEIKSKGKSGVVVLHFGSEGELDRLFEALKHGPKLGVRR